jgi:hypothetical protein
MLGRIRKYQDKELLGRRRSSAARQICRPKDFDHYLRERLVFDTAGMCGEIKSVQAALVELPAVALHLRHRTIRRRSGPPLVWRSSSPRFARSARTGSGFLSGNTGLLLDGR